MKNTTLRRWGIRTATVLPVLAAVIVLSLHFRSTPVQAQQAVSFRRVFGAVNVVPGQQLKLTVSNVLADDSVFIDAKVLDDTGGTLVDLCQTTQCIVQIGDLPVVEIPAGQSRVVTFPDGANPSFTGLVTSVIELIKPRSQTATPLISAQVVEKSTGRVAVWGTDGTAVWGTDGTALEAQHRIAKPTGGALQSRSPKRVLAFAPVGVGSQEKYRLSISNIFSSEPVTVSALILDGGNNIIGGEDGVIIPAGETITVDSPMNNTTTSQTRIGFLDIVDQTNPALYPLVTMQVVNVFDNAAGKVGVWGTDGTAYEVDESF